MTSTKTSARRAFVVAMSCEADAIRPLLQPGDRLCVSGVGKVNAAAATQKAIGEGAMEVWNVGVAGSFCPELCVGMCVVVDRAVEYDFNLSEVNGTRIGVHNERETPYFDCAADFAQQLPRVTLATGDHFVDGAADMAVLSGLGAAVRDMEGAAVAHVCERNGIVCRIVKAISDVHGYGSMLEQYRDCRDIALAALSDAMRKVMAER